MDHSFAKKGIKIIGVIFVIYVGLVATHEGEFWPFSIYPMFSQAGNPWTRAIVLNVTDLPDDQIWEKHLFSERVAEPVPLKEHGIDQIDFSNFISKTQNWTPERRDALQFMFGQNNLKSQRWMASKVEGKLIENDSVVVEIKPYLLVTADTVRMNPTLDESEYISGEE
ncbi:MAG: hypothetical protein U5K72_17860 [Balneolaceae bacterium]|nr:hypothetical protein [Balneolaceae bacterium]